MHVDHVGLSVGDLESQLDWYGRVFGFERASRFEVAEAGLRIGFLAGPDGVAIELIESAGSRSGARASTLDERVATWGWGHLCFRVADVDSVFAGAIACGGRVISAPAPSIEEGTRFAYLADPEGNFIELLDRAGPVGCA